MISVMRCAVRIVQRDIIGVHTCCQRPELTQIMQLVQLLKHVIDRLCPALGLYVIELISEELSPTVAVTNRSQYMYHN